LRPMRSEDRRMRLSWETVLSLLRPGFIKSVRFTLSIAMAVGVAD
jgi:hypothetical protein